MTETKNSRRGRGAETAGGGSIVERGEVTLDLKIDGSFYRLPVRDMDVSMPIASGRSCLATGENYAIIHPNGGVIKNMATGKEIQLYGKNGVFYFKADILPPGSITGDMPLPFTRQR